MAALKAPPTRAGKAAARRAAPAAPPRAWPGRADTSADLPERAVARGPRAARATVAASARRGAPVWAAPLRAAAVSAEARPVRAAARQLVTAAPAWVVAAA